MGNRNRRLVQTGALFAVLAVVGVASYVWGRGEDDSARPRPLFAAPEPTASIAPLPSPTVAARPSPSPIAAGLAVARDLHREGRFSEARAAYQALAAAPSGAEARAQALVGAATVSFELGDEARGFADLEAAVQAAPEGSASAVTARYLLLKRLNDVGRSEEAGALFRSAPALASDSPVAPYYAFEGGRATWAQGGRDIWAALLDSPATSPALRATILRENVARWRAVGDSTRLATALDALIRDSADPEARFERAELAEAAGDMSTFAAQLRAIVAGNAGSRFAGLAIDRLEAAGYEVDPGLAGLSHYRRGQYARAKEVLLPAVASAPTPNDLALRAYFLAASYEDSGDAASAVRYYDMAASSGATTDYVHRAMFWAARVTESTGAALRASERYVQLARSPNGEFSEEAAFRAGFVLYDVGDVAGALQAWAGMDGAVSARLEYWRGRALRELGDASGARAAFQRAVALGPLDLHGVEAARELGQAPPFDVSYRHRDLDQPIDWSAIASWLSGRVGGSAPGSAPTAACELMAAGLRSAAAAEITAADTGDIWRTFELMREASECGLTDLAARMAVAIRIEAGVASHEPPADLLRVSYPVDFGATVDVEARKAGIDPLFFAALIRQESFWDPSALSIADARGLTQVIPPTADAIAAELGVSEFRISDLYRPALSLEFGAHYLGGQVRTYGDPLVALSAYNAGPGNAARWRAARADSAADLVEVIDFVETRNYVMYIYEAYAHYQLAWGGDGR